jgi:hypothetical protein
VAAALVFVVLGAFAEEADFEVVVALVDFDGTKEPLAGRTGRAPGVTGACKVRRCARGGPVQHSHTPGAFPRTRSDERTAGAVPDRRRA